jgi:hypothetical protein
MLGPDHFSYSHTLRRKTEVSVQIADGSFFPLTEPVAEQLR